MAVATRTRKTAETIKAATIARVSDKSGKFLGFLVKSNHGNVYYQIRCTGKDSYTCTCEAKLWGHAECCHIKAVRELVAARRQNELDEAAAVVAAVLPEMADDLQAHVDDALSAQQERERKMAANQAYRDMFPDDYGYCDVA